VKALQAGDNGTEIFDILSTMIESDSGHLGMMLRRYSGRQHAREAGVADSQTFPLPLMRQVPLPVKGRSRERAKRRNLFCKYVNICIVAFNWLFAGAQCGSRLKPSAVQQRIHGIIFDSVVQLLRGGVSASGERQIGDFLRESQHAYWTVGGHCLPLGLKAGVPEKAAVVDLFDVLQKFDMKIAKQVQHPGELLLPRKLRPSRLPRPFCKLDSSYRDYVRRNCQAGLQKLKPLKTIYKVKGKPLYGGAFAVAKNADEDRAISALCPLNALVDVDKLWVPKFAIMPAMRAMTLATGHKLRVYKKDARHFFHFLKIGKRWEKFMAHPPLKAQDGHAEKFPVHLGVPMGFTAAAAWAQAYNEQKAREAGLPAESRLVDGRPPPKGFPIWGSILDDVWAIEEDPPADRAVGQEWLQRVSDLWAEDGLAEHIKKAVVGSTCEEVQGAMVDGIGGWVGVSRQKRMSVLEAGLYLVSQRRPLVGAVDRWIGKFSFALGFRSCARSILQDEYSWLDIHRKGSKRAWLWPAVRNEMIMACILLPFLQTNLRAQWCSRVECSDAAPGGHGRAWATLPVDLVAEAARLCTNKGVYTNISTEYGVELNSDGICPLQQVRLPFDKYKWQIVAKPGGYRHITFEEAAALNWSLLDRLKHPKELHSKVLQGVDSAAAAGAYKKGRSASRALNGLCRQACAIICCGDLEPFLAWVPTGENPADAPSSLYGIRAGAVQTKPAAREPRPTAVFNVSSFSRDENETTTVHWAKEHETLKRWVAGGLCEQSVDAIYQEGLPQIFIHVCSGPRRRGDYIDQCMKLARQNYQQCLGLRIDPSIDPRLDILNGSLVILIRQLIDEGRLGGLLCTPPCGTWSRVRHVPLNRGCAGPRPLRTRDAPLTCISDRSMKEHKACETGTRIATACVYLVGLALEHFIWTALVHPQDPGLDPFPSVFHLPMADLLRKFGARDICLDQCQFGSPVRKPTQMLVRPSLDFFRHLQQRCNHVTSH